MKDHVECRINKTSRTKNVQVCVFTREDIQRIREQANARRKKKILGASLISERCRRRAARRLRIIKAKSFDDVNDSCE